MITGKPLFTVEHIQNRVKELASKISEDYEGKELFSVGILRGAFMFFADIVKLIQIPMTIDFINVSSYAKTASTGEITVHTDLRDDIAGKHVLLIEDIIDTGLTLRHIREMLLKRDPASLKICVFLDKKSRRIVEVPLDYVGFEIPNEYVVGYGLDYENKFRNLPYIAIFKKDT
ncbi:MAG: hypoxanthine phosphoribosyltransferase [Thermodesulfovibrionia bacterium]|nr:hypoxanthine phosphoribosyltransferase [Thermodesulfovibrionia bacterium]MCK5512536.1 hypoxanthine phosphoribosyltransferase [Thermodesulfovibrionia bacterium]